MEHLNAEAAEKFAEIIAPWAASSKRFAYVQVRYIFRAAKNVVGAVVAGENVFAFDTISADQCVALLDALVYRPQNVVEDTDDEYDLGGDAEIAGDKRTPMAIYTSYLYVLRLLMAHKRDNLSKNRAVIDKICAAEAAATAAKHSAELYHRVPPGATYVSVREKCRQLMDAGDKLGAKNAEKLIAHIAAWLYYLPPMRAQDYISATYAHSSPATEASETGNVVDLDTRTYILRDFKTKKSFARRYGVAGRYIDLPDELVTYIRGRNLCVPGGPVFSAGHGKLSASGFYATLGRNIGLTIGQLRVLYVSEYMNGADVNGELLAKTAYIMGHTVTTQQRDYRRT